MDSTEPLKIFSRVAEMGSFTQAAESLGLAKAKASTAVQRLEAELGVRLFHRTTRRVQLTLDGQVFYERCKELLVDLDELQSMFRQPGQQALQGRVRIDMSTGVAQHIVVPRLTQFLQLHPELHIELSSTERRVDLVREGFDCVLRVGALGVAEAGLVARPLGLLPMVNCASPRYLGLHGQPQTLGDLARHQLIHFVNTLGAKSSGFEWTDGDTLRTQAMAGSITVNNAEAYQAACLAGLGVIQVPRLAVQAHLEAGRLVEVMSAHPAPAMPLHLLFANRRHLTTRVKVVMDWLSAVIAEHLQTHSQ